MLKFPSDLNFSFLNELNLKSYFFSKLTFFEKKLCELQKLPVKNISFPPFSHSIIISFLIFLFNKKEHIFFVSIFFLCYDRKKENFRMNYIFEKFEEQLVLSLG